MTDQKPEYVELFEWMTGLSVFYERRLDGCWHYHVDPSISRPVPNLAIDTAENERILREGIEGWCDKPCHWKKIPHLRLEQQVILIPNWSGKREGRGKRIHGESVTGWRAEITSLNIKVVNKTYHAALLALASKLMTVGKDAEVAE